ncbi:class V lanthionine synthetase subunit LxmK [Nocardia sp. KC 131]|uniref:class V lanthionine synthetase subunit LxmK n=1 Tax=Nocardia arseniciresistens TaxID=3392119 RepID=UPI00398F851A
MVLRQLDSDTNTGARGIAAAVTPTSEPMGSKGKDPAKGGYEPIDLDRVPAVNALLERIGIGAFDPTSVSAPVGRNNAWSGRTVEGREVFVKQLIGSARDLDRRMARILAFESFSTRLPEGALLSPALLGSDSEARIVAFDLVEDARTGAELMVDEEFSTDLAAEVGRKIAMLHTGATDAEDLDRSVVPFPSVTMLEGIPLEVFENSSAGTIETWRLLQNDAELIDGVRQLRTWEAAAPKVPAHCDFRVDQLLISDRGVHITDWEEFRVADGARDVGAFAGEWLYRSVLDIVTIRGDSEFAEFELTHETILERGAEKLARLVPLTEAFWAAYQDVRPQLDDQFITRATAFAGWHLLDRLLAIADMAARLNGISRAAAGIGRGALLAPDRFAEAIGLA